MKRRRSRAQLARLALSLALLAPLAAACDSAPVPLPTATVEQSPAPTGVSPVAPTPSVPASAGVPSSQPATAPPSETPTASPVETPFVPAVVVTSDDGLVTIGIPSGALPEGATLTATTHGVADLPPELFGLQVRDAFYEISPADVELASPVQVTRRISYRAMGVDPETDGTPVLALAMRPPAGSWQWLDSQKLATEGPFVTVSGWG